MTNTNPNQLLRTAFPELNETDIAALSQAAKYRSIAAGLDIVHQGEMGAKLFVLEEGQANILVHADDNHEILVDTIGPNDYFGEMAFLGETTRTATIRAVSPCRILAIDEQDFMRVAQTNPDLLRNLLRQIIGHLRRNDQAVIQELNLKNVDLEQAYRELAEQEKLRTEFIATLSHEIRTPLTSVRGFLGLINQGAIQGDSLRVALESITRNVERMVGLTNDLLIMYEMHPSILNIDYLNLADVLIEALNDVRTTLGGHTADVILDIAPDLPDLYADRRSVTLALRALTENAFKFNPDKAPVAITVFACNHKENGQQEIAISVRDEGIGIPYEDQERIFEPFVRLETEGNAHIFPGLGVGLTIAKYMVERHNGCIQVDSQPGRGSTFTIYLPLTA